MPSEVLKELLTCNGALKVCEFAKESMEKTMKCWIEGVEEKEAWLIDDKDEFEINESEIKDKDVR